MTFALIIAVGIAGWCCLKWYWADEHCKRLLKANHRLIEINLTLQRAINPERPRPPVPDHKLWSSDVYERIAKDAGVKLAPTGAELRLVEPAAREAHSHAEKGSA